MALPAAWRRVSRRVSAACPRVGSVMFCMRRSIFLIASGAVLLRVVLNRFQSASLKLNCWQIGWMAVSSVGVVVISNRMTLWSDPVVASSTAQLVMDLAEEGVAKARPRTDAPAPFL